MKTVLAIFDHRPRAEKMGQKHPNLSSNEVVYIIRVLFSTF